MTFDEIEQSGLEDAWYEHPPKPPRFFASVYMRGYWNGCHLRADEERRMEILYRAWAAEDAGSEPPRAEASGRAPQEKPEP